jgi:hypothetical protein
LVNLVGVEHLDVLREACVQPCFDFVLPHVKPLALALEQLQNVAALGLPTDRVVCTRTRTEIGEVGRYADLGRRKDVTGQSRPRTVV